MCQSNARCRGLARPDGHHLVRDYTMLRESTRRLPPATGLPTLLANHAAHHFLHRHADLPNLAPQPRSVPESTSRTVMLVSMPAPPAQSGTLPRAIHTPNYATRNPRSKACCSRLPDTPMPQLSSAAPRALQNGPRALSWLRVRLRTQTHTRIQPVDLATY